MMRLAVAVLLVALGAVPALAQPPAPATDVRINAPASDTTGPTVTITSPTSSTTYDNGTTSTIDLAGTASDARTITGCTWSNALTGGSGVVTGTTAWTVSAASLNVGSNAITVSCSDIVGNSGNDVLTVTRSSSSGGGGFSSGVQPNPTLTQMGLPAPPFGIDETVASEYGSDCFATHVFNNSGTIPGGSCFTVSTCNDAVGNGTFGAPRCNPPTMTALAAGSVVQGCGTFARGTSDITITASGTVSDPVFVREATGCTLHFNFTGAGNVIASGSAYLIMENFSVVERDGLAITSANHVSLRGTDISGNGTSADSGGMVEIANSSYIVRAGNTIHDGGDWSYAAAENDTHCLAVPGEAASGGGNATFIWDLWNTAYHCSGDGWGNGHDADHTDTDMYVGGNLFYENRENCVDIKEVTRVIVTFNECHTIVGTVASAATREGIVIHQGPTSQQGTAFGLVMNNRVYNIGVGIASGDLRRTVNNKVWYIGNVIYDCSAGTAPSGISLNTSGSPDTEHTFAHNTIADCPAGILVGSQVESLNQGGNIVVSASGRHYQNDTTTTTGVTTVNRELFYQGGSNVAISWNATSVTYTTVAAWISGTGKGTGSLQSDPQFTDAAGRDYSVPGTSPVCGAGMDMSSIRTEISGIFGFDPLTYDIAGTARPTGSTRWAIGAYECP
jgi:hypothetical protein